MKLINIFIIIASLALSSCGYKALNNSSNYNFKINDIKITGDKKINNHLNRNFQRFVNNNNASRIFDLKIETKINKKTTSKDTQGKETGFSIEINVKLDVYENNILLDSVNFQRNISYNNLNSQFELKQYENVLIKDLSDQIILDINSFIGAIK